MAKIKFNRKLNLFSNQVNKKMQDEILNEIIFIEISENPAIELSVYAVQAEILKNLKPYGW
jgi:hypothetical protein